MNFRSLLGLRLRTQNQNLKKLDGDKGPVVMSENFTPANALTAGMPSAGRSESNDWRPRAGSADVLRNPTTARRPLGIDARLGQARQPRRQQVVQPVGIDDRHKPRVGLAAGDAPQSTTVMPEVSGLRFRSRR